VPGTLRDYPPRILFPTQPNRNNVYFVNFDMVQANVILFSRDVPCDISLMPAGTLFNEYFGSGPSSIVFQEVRESKGLAYSAFARYAVAWVPDDDNILYGFVGTQADKMPQALQTMLTLLKKMPRAGKQFSLAQQSVIDRISTERIHGTDIYFTWLENLDRGSDHDLRKDVYEEVQKMTMDDLEHFFNDHVAKENYTFLILGNRENLDTMMMKKLGNFKELSLEEIFGY
jgi:predicted Zn-dependent peptidase